MMARRIRLRDAGVEGREPGRLEEVGRLSLHEDLAARS